MTKRSLVSALARSFLAGEPQFDQLIARGSQTLGRNWDWLGPLARRYLETTAETTRPRHRDLIQFILQDPEFHLAWSKHRQHLTLEQWLAEPQRMQPAAAARTWDVPVIATAGDLADWFWLEQTDLEWFADLNGLGHKQIHNRLRHYHYRAQAKRSGSIRLIEAPKRRLKRLQRQILAGILENVPPHPAAHGFIKGRSIKTFTAPHVGRRVVLRMDLRDFFASISRARVQSFFRTLGYPESVSDLLGGICTNAVPRDAWNQPATEVDARQLEEAREIYSKPHLPQGAPTSPAIANCCALHLDCRLAGLAKSAGAQYTRYADDLAFSGGEMFERSVERFSSHVATISLEEGFTVHHRKTRIMHQGVRQHLAGLVTNQRINVRRTDFDCLKAALTNCVRFGPESQNRDAHPYFRLHLEGRIAFVEMINPARGKRLRTLFESIEWP